MKPIFIFLIALLVLFFSCKDKEQEQLLLETQKAYLGELIAKEILLWEATESQYRKEIPFNHFDFTTYETYRNDFLITAENPTIINVSQLSLVIDTLTGIFQGFDEFDNIEYSFVETADSIDLLGYQIELYKTHTDFLQLLLNSTKSLDGDSWILQKCIVQYDASIIKQGENFEAELFVIKGEVALPIQNVYLGEFDTTKIIDSVYWKPQYVTKDENDIPLLSYHKEKNHGVHRIWEYIRESPPIGKYVEQGVAQVETYKGNYEFYPFEFSYEVVDCF
ncbi:MAG: hypothetical protein ACPG4Z_01775 [Chitinophagales bacterium]